MLAQATLAVAIRPGKPRAVAGWVGGVALAAGVAADDECAGM